MGWSFPWVSFAPSGYNFDVRFSHTLKEGREVVEQMMGDGPRRSSITTVAPPGTDATAYMTESPGFRAFVLEDGVVYQTCGDDLTGFEFVMAYYPILDHAPRP